MRFGIYFNRKLCLFFFKYSFSIIIGHLLKIPRTGLFSAPKIFRQEMENKSITFVV